MIQTKNIVIPYSSDNIAIEKSLKANGINPLRWAIVEVTETDLTVSVSFECE